MDELDQQASETPQQAEGQPERVSRRRLLKMLAASGTAVAAFALPEAWSQPKVEAADLPCPKPKGNPVLFDLHFDREARAHFDYFDPEAGVRDTTTLMGVSVASTGQLNFAPFATYQAERIGTPALGTVVFQPSNACTNTSHTLQVQLKVFAASGWNGSYRLSNIVSTAC